LIDIIEAIATKYDATAAMQTGVTGGCHQDHPGQGNVRPFVVIVPVSAVPEYDTSRTYAQDCSIQISIFANTLAEIRPIKKAWIEALNHKPLTLGTGKVIDATLTNEMPQYNEAENDAFSAWHYVLEFTFTQLQTLPT
jgi:hypothetical protein